MKYNLRHLVPNKRLQPPVITVYDFKTMIVETEDQSKLKKLRKNPQK